MTFPASLADTPTNTPEQYPGVFAERVDDAPAGVDGDPPGEYSEGLQVGYKWYQEQGIEPLFAFGHGLSYTTFAYDKVKVTPKSTNGEKEIRISFKITNTGDRAGTETAQAYVDAPRLHRRTGNAARRVAGRFARARASTPT